MVVITVSLKFIVTKLIFELTKVEERITDAVGATLSILIVAKFFVTVMVFPATSETP